MRHRITLSIALLAIGVFGYGNTAQAVTSQTVIVNGGAAQQVTFWDAASTLNGSSGLTWTGSTLGVATSTPSANHTLAVSGNAWFTGIGSPLSYTVVGAPIVNLGAAVNNQDIFVVSSSTVTGTTLRISNVTGEYDGSDPTGSVTGSNTNTICAATADLSTITFGGACRNRFVSNNKSLGHLVSLMSGGGFRVNSTGTLSTTTDAIAALAESPTVNAGNVFTNEYGFFAQGGAISGTITNRYGVYVDDLLGGTNLWGVYQKGATNTNYFAASTGVGTTSPSAKLSVHLNAASPQPLAFAIGSSTPTATTTLLSTTSGGQTSACEATPATSTSMTINFQNTCNQVLIQLGFAGTTITLSGGKVGDTKRLVVVNPNGTAGTITWAGLVWVGGTAPTQTTTANGGDIYSCFVTQATSTTAGNALKTECAASTGLQ